MGIISRLEKANSRASITFDPMNHEMVRAISGGTSVAGKMVTAESAMNIAAAWACMRLIAETIGALPLAIYERDDKGNAKKIDHHLSDVLIRTPNTEMTSLEYREAMAMNLCQNGNAYSFKDTLGGRVVSLVPIEARFVTPMKKSGSNTRLDIAEGDVFFRVTDRGQPEDFPRDKVWHIKGFSANGLVGLSPLSAAREALGFGLALEEFGSRFFKQGAMPAGTVSIPHWLTKEQKRETQEAISEMLGGLGNAHQIALFQGGMKPEPWGNMPLKDMEFLLLRQSNVLEICRYYLMPPHMVGEFEKGASYASMEQKSQDFATYTMAPYFRRFEEAFERWLLPASERGRIIMRFNFDGLMRADSAARATFLSSMVQNGLMSRNEGRAKENLNRSDAPGMDDYTAQSNLLPVNDLGKLAKQPTAAMT